MSECSFPTQIMLNGKKYVHGPEIPEASRGVPGKCAKCAGAKLGCVAFGHECLLNPGVYWVEKTGLDRPREKLADIPSGERAVCPKCRHKFRKSESAKVYAAGAAEDWCPWCAAEHASACKKCGKLASAEYTATVDGEYWCCSCAGTESKTCDKCGKHTTRPLTAVGLAGGGTGHWCKECVTAKAVTCPDCNHLVDNETAYTVDGVRVCAVCALAAPVCESCGERTRSAVEVDTADGAVRMCPACAARAAAALVHGYHDFSQRHNPRFWSMPEDGDGTLLYMGFELEAGGASEQGSGAAASGIHRLDPTEVRFHLERDATIPHYGFEIISAPHTLAAHKAWRWDEVVKLLSARGLKSHDLNGQCGLHVHVSRDFLTSADCIKLDLFVLKNRLFWERVSRRSASDFAAYKSKGSLSEFGRSSERRVALNFTNAVTVEFRMFRGTLKYNTLMATLEIVDGLCRWVKTKTVDEMMNNEGETDKFAAWLAGRGAGYARAVSYIAERGAVTDPDADSAGAGD